VGDEKEYNKVFREQEVCREVAENVGGVEGDRNV
jgi:hypothetical protein